MFFLIGLAFGVFLVANLLWWDGFDDCDASNLNLYYVGAAALIEDDQSPHGKSLSGYVRRMLDAEGAEHWNRWWLKPQLNKWLIRLYHGVDTQFGISVDASGFLHVYAGSELAISDSQLLFQDVACTLDVYTKIDDSAGAFEIWKNDELVMSGTGLDTANIAGHTCNGVGLGDALDPKDDWSICDTEGAAPWNTRLGASGSLGGPHVETLFPSAAGNYSTWTPSAGNNYECVDENATSYPNTTDSVSSANPTDTDTYAYTNLSSTDLTVLGVMGITVAQKSDSGARTLREIMRIGGTDYEEATDMALAEGTYAAFVRIYQQQPTTPAANWTPTVVNALEHGQTVHS